LLPEGERLHPEHGQARGCGEPPRRAADPVDGEADQALRLPAARRRVRSLARGDGPRRRATARRGARDPARADRLPEGLPRREGRPARRAAPARRGGQGGLLDRAGPDRPAFGGVAERFAQWLSNQLRSRTLLRRYGLRMSRPSGPRRSQLTVLAASSPGVGRLALTDRGPGP